MLPQSRQSIARIAMSLIAICVMLQTPGVLAEQTREDTPDKYADFQALVYEDGQGGSLPYRLIVPEHAEGPMPLLLFLHGAGKHGNDNQRQLIWGKELLLKAVREFGCIVVVPQCPAEQVWSNVDWSQDKVTFPDEPSGPMRMAQAVIDDLVQLHDVDTDRLYIMGLSMGGYGSWDAVSRWPGRFAATAPICGGGDPALAEKIVDTPVWAFHGEADPVVSVELTRAMIQAIKDAGGDPKYTEYPDVGHNSWTPAFAEPDLLAWMMSKSLTPDSEDAPDE